MAPNFQSNVVVVFRGQRIEMSQQEFAAFQTQIAENFRRKVLPQIKMRVTESRILYDHFKQLNSDQPIVSWFIELTRRTDLPNQKLITDAENAYQELERAITCANLNMAHKIYPLCEGTINRAVETMRKYRSEMISGGENWITGLDLTKSASFAILGAAATVYTGGAAGGTAMTMFGSTAAAQVTTAGAVSALQAMAEEGGKAMANSNGQSWTSAGTNIITSFLTSGIAEKLFMGPGGKEVAKKLAGKILAKSGEKILKTVSKETAERLIAEYLENTGKAVVSGAISDVGKATTDKDSRSVDQFLDNVATNLMKGGIEGKLASSLTGMAK